MKIRKHGKKYTKEQVKTEEFDCENCGCEFVCKEDEYYEDFGGADSPSWTGGSITVSTYTICSVIKDYLVCSCPECHKIVKKTRERQNLNYYTSLTGTSTTGKTDNTFSNTLSGSYESDLNIKPDKN